MALTPDLRNTITVLTMNRPPENMTVEEYGQWLVGAISQLPSGNERSAFVDQYLLFCKQIDLLELSYDLDPYEELAKRSGLGSSEPGT